MLRGIFSQQNSVSPDVFVPLSGVSSSGQLGALQVLNDANVLLSGVSSSGNIGALEVAGGSNVLLTGVAGRGQLGLLTGTPTWANGSNALTISGSNRAVTALTSSTVAVANTTASSALRIYSLSGITWSLVSGSTLNITNGLLSVVALDSSTVATIRNNIGTNTLGTYSWNGSSWSLVGSTISTGYNSPIMIALSSTRIIVCEYAGSNARAYDWNGSTWTAGTSTTFTSSKYGMAALTSTTFATISGTELRTHSFNGVSFSVVGNALTVSNGSNARMAALSSTRVVYGLNDPYTYDFDGTDWTQTLVNDTSAWNQVGSISLLTNNTVATIAGDTSLRTYVLT